MACCQWKDPQQLGPRRRYFRLKSAGINGSVCRADMIDGLGQPGDPLMVGEALPIFRTVCGSFAEAPARRRSAERDRRQLSSYTAGALRRRANYARLFALTCCAATPFRLRRDIHR